MHASHETADRKLKESMALILHDAASHVATDGHLTVNSYDGKNSLVITRNIISSTFVNEIERQLTFERTTTSTNHLRI